MPFITEEIYQAIPHTDDSVMISAYPEYDEAKTYKAEAEDVERIIACITATRARRAEMNVPPSKKAKMFVVTKYEETFKRASKILEKLASASEVIITDKYESDDAVTVATSAGSMFIPLSEVIDFEKEKARLSAEMQKNDGEIERIEKKLSNEGFVAKAPKQVVDAERAKLEKYRETKAALEKALAKLK
jgi:valyl-tRNA synthetase